MSKNTKKSRFRPKIKILKGDMVKVISGADKGKEGAVLSVDYSTQKAFVEGVRVVTKHSKPDAANPDGGILKQEAAVHISNLMLVDPKSGQPTKVGRKLVDGKLVRYAKKSGEVI